MEALAGARALAASGGEPAAMADAFEHVVREAGESTAVRDALRDVPAGRCLVRFTDAEFAFDFSAGDGALAIARSDKRGPGPKVDATAATWLGLVSGTLKPWLAFTRGLVVCRAGLNELRWLQQVAERLQAAYARSVAPTSAQGTA